jgi:ankyrin repeat protein
MHWEHSIETDARTFSEWVSGFTVLHLATSLYNCSIVEYILNANHVTDINAVDDRGRTVLSLAMFYGCTQNVRALLSKDVEATIKDKESGEFPFGLGACYCYTTIVRIILHQRLPNDNYLKPDFIALSYGHLYVARVLAEHAEKQGIS